MNKFGMLRCVEQGFRNELIIQMFFRQAPAGVNVVYHGLRFKQINFLTKGKIGIQTKDGLCFFELHEGIVFGDYQHIFGLKSNFVFKALGENEEKTKKEDIKSYPVNYMAVAIDIWDDLCQLYPKSASACKDIAILKRDVILHYMNCNLELTKNRETGIPAQIADGSEAETPTSVQRRESKKLLDQKINDDSLELDQAYNTNINDSDA